MSDDETPNPLTALLGLVEVMGPILDTAKGLKAQMEAAGWSPSAAEDVAREFMVGMIYKAFH